MPKVSSQVREYSRFEEILGGDEVRSVLRGAVFQCFRPYSPAICSGNQGSVPYGGFESLSLRHQNSANRTASRENHDNSTDFAADFAQENLARPPQSLSIGAGEWIFLHSLRTAV